MKQLMLTKIKEMKQLTLTKLKEMKEEQPEFNKLTPEEIEDYEKLLNYYMDNPKEFEDLREIYQDKLMSYWIHLEFKISKALKNIYEGNTINNNQKNL